MGFKTINGKAVFFPDPIDLPFEEKQKLLRTTGFGSIESHSNVSDETRKFVEDEQLKKLPTMNNQQLKNVINNRHRENSPKVVKIAMQILEDRASKGQVDFNVLE